jgi:hypothetical protein
MSDHKAKITFKLAAGTPTWDVDPDSLPVPHGKHKTVLWEITNTSTPGAKFPSTDGIVFKGPNIWPGTNPVKLDDQVYASVENNDNPGPGSVKYPYTITVEFEGQLFQHDPDVDNDPPPPGPGEEGEEDHEHDHEHGHDHHGGKADKKPS